jgi:hypothetical protein
MAGNGNFCCHNVVVAFVFVSFVVVVTALQRAKNILSEANLQFEKDATKVKKD